MLTLLLLLLFCLVRLLRFWSRRRLHGYRRLSEPQRTAYHRRRKPEWVRREVIRLKALLRESGTCRAIADIFNRRFAQRRKMTVGRTWVSELIRDHRYEIEVVGRQIKNAKPRPGPKNLIWGIDLTGKTTLDGTTRLILGIIEHASRAALALEAL